METKSSGGISFCGVLFVVFLVLKLCKVIAWSWWWVCSPLWIPLALAIVLVIVGFTVNLYRIWKMKRRR